LRKRLETRSLRLNNLRRGHPPPGRDGAEGEEMSKEKKSAEEQVADEAKRRALNPNAAKQTKSDGQAEPEF
jgi:hypothetical protein